MLHGVQNFVAAQQVVEDLNRKRACRHPYRQDRIRTG
jgi:hypothetical protein